MSKKLLMNNYSENGLKPVTNGLICWLDGRDYVTGERIWKDRSGQRAHAQLIEPGIFKNNSLYYGGYGTIENPTLNLEEYTIEIYMKDLRKRYWNSLWGNYGGGSGNSFVLYRPEIIASYPYSSSINFSPKEKNILTFIYRNSIMGACVNGIQTNLACQFPPSVAKYLVVCARKKNSASIDDGAGADNQINEWYSIKIYNRALTEEEIKQNYQYEQSIERG